MDSNTTPGGEHRSNTESKELRTGRIISDINIHCDLHILITHRGVEVLVDVVAAAAVVLASPGPQRTDVLATVNIRVNTSFISKIPRINLYQESKQERE